MLLKVTWLHPQQWWSLAARRRWRKLSTPANCNNHNVNCNPDLSFYWKAWGEALSSWHWQPVIVLPRGCLSLVEVCEHGGRSPIDRLQGDLPFKNIIRVSEKQQGKPRFSIGIMKSVLPYLQWQRAFSLCAKLCVQLWMCVSEPWYTTTPL